MIGYDRESEIKLEEYLVYLCRLAEKRFCDCPDIDMLVQDTHAVLVLKLDRGEEVKHPKAFLSAVLKNKYNAWLRERYKNELLEYTDDTACESRDDIADSEQAELQRDEYEAVRREIGRLVRIYREVTVLHYVHGRSVEEISRELGIPRGTVLSRLSSARDQIREGLEDMEKYSQISYEPKTASIGIWGSVGLANEPFSLIKSDIETNALILAYENPVSVRGIADTMGMPSAYIEPIIDRLVEGELMGRTAGGLVYTRCFVQMYEDSFGDIAAQEELASQYASRVWEVAWKHLEPLTKREELASMSGKQIATMLLFAMNQALTTVVVGSRPDRDALPTKPPARPDTGCWLATLTVYEHGQGRDIKYEGSGPVVVNYKNEVGGRSVCRMYDCQSLFGEAHWAYGRFNYKCSLQSILRFYASLLPCDVKTDNEYLYELIPEFEELGILKRGSDGEIGLDVPAITFDEMREHWEPAIKRIETELERLLSGMLERLWKRHRNRVPKHVDEARYFVYSGSTGAYVKAQLLAIVEQGLLPYPVEIGKTPLICVLYRRCDG